MWNLKSFLFQNIRVIIFENWKVSFGRSKLRLLFHDAFSASKNPTPHHPTHGFDFGTRYLQFKPKPLDAHIHGFGINSTVISPNPS